MFKKRLLSMVLLVGMLLGQTIPSVHAATMCDQAQFISDITVPDGAAFAPATSFSKTWRFMNVGSCTWTTSYSIVFAGGDNLGSSAPFKLPVEVPPGQMVDITVNLTAPAMTGHYKSLWKFSNASGVQFGTGDSGANVFWADINVVVPNDIIYDFTANAANAQWKSGVGALAYPGTNGDSRGFAYKVDQPHLEDDSFDSLPGLFMAPQNKYNGYIQATFPEYAVQPGDKLQTLVNCEFGATGCYVTFRIDYILPNGGQIKLWQWKESYDQRFYRADIDLSPLAGKNVRFVFMVLASGFASKDRVIWGSPRIVRAGTVQLPPSNETLPPPPQPTLPPPTLAPTDCDRASFIADVNVPDGTAFTPGAAFSKTWKLKNSGKCAWTTDYKLTYYSGEQMGAPASVNLPFKVYPGSTADLTINLVAPNTAGKYRGFWILSNASGAPFGIGTNAANPFWVDIQVAGNAFNENGYDFAANACAAQWKSGAGILPCPGGDGDANGFVISANYTQLEDGTVGPAPSLLISPQNKYNGYIQGFYPAIDVQPGDRFHTVVGCEKGYSCYVTFRLDYMTPNGYIGNFWSRREYSDNKNFTVDVDLTPLAGKSVKLILTILATGSSANDRVRWTAPYLLRKSLTPPPTATQVPTSIWTPTPSTNGWLTYTNSSYNFEYNYPSQSQITNQSSGFVHINLPIQSGTNLREKYLETTVTENASSCQSSLPQPPNGITETVSVNGINFLRQTGGDAAAGNLYQWEAYSTYRGNNCINTTFLLHSLSAGAFDPPIPEFDKATESAVFTQIMQTFKWIDNTVPPAPTSTPVPVNSGVPLASPTIYKLFMLDALNGWALNYRYVIRTTDGGATWYGVLPESNPSNGYFQSPTKGWVISSAFEIARTTDGGQNWTRYTTPFNGGYIQFLDDNNGFVLYGEGSGMQKQAVALYQTFDGGATWTLKYNNDPMIPNPGTTLPFSGHKNGMSFKDTTTGWVGGDYPVNGYIYLFKTSDSGSTWSQVSLSLPAGYESAYITTTAPKFFGTSDGILPVWMTLSAGAKDLFLYITHDGGNTWAISPVYARNAEHTDITSLSHAISWDWANIFHATTNTGNSWTNITPNVVFGDGFRELDFISPNVGWARLQTADGLTTLYRTVDGGAHWTLLYGTPPASPTQTSTPLPPTPTSIPTATPTASVTSLKAKVTADLLSCRYGPGVEYLYLYALNKDANITLIGRTDANNWVWVSGTNKCWVNSNYLTITGDRKTLPVVYPDIAKLPVSPYYPGPSWASAFRNGNSVGVEWEPVPISAGKYADANMHQYLLEVWRCEAGQIKFETLGSNSPSIVVPKDEPGCSEPSHARVFVQEKHGYGGPIIPPWPQPVSPATSTPVSYQQPTHDAFCADTRIPLLISQLKAGANQSNGSLFSSLVSPSHGLDVRLWAYAAPVNFSAAKTGSIFTDTTSYTWGGGPSGIPDTGTFKNAIQPKLLDVLNTPNMETYCDSLDKVYPLMTPWPYEGIRYYNLYKPGTPGIDLDYRTWLIGFEYINGEPYLHSMVTIIWEP